MKDPLWTEGNTLTDGWASGTAPSNAWTVGAALTDGWTFTGSPFDFGILGDDDEYIIGDDDEYLNQD